MTRRLFIILAAMTFFGSACQSNAAADPSAASATPRADASQNTGPNDFSNLSYTQAFDKMFEIVRTTYAFNGVAGKQPDWESVYMDIQPRVRQAEEDGDAQAYFLALRDFTLAFRDGNVNLGGGELQVSLFRAATEGGYGFAVRELDDGRVLATYVKAGGPAEGAGMRLGAQVVSFNGQPIHVAIEAATLWGAPPSMESSARYQKSRYLTRALVGTEAAVEFVNPGGPPQTATLTAIAERDSFAVTSVFLSYNAEAPPVTYRRLPSGIGYIRITSTADNRDLIASLFESALRDLETAGASGLILDLRVVVNLAPDASLPPLGLAGFLTEQAIPLGQLQYFDAASGKFENEGSPQKILPKANRYRFSSLALLVGPGCSSGCEVEAYAFSQIPGMIVVGQTPSAGEMADVAGGQFLLPEKFSLQIPTGRFTLPDGGIWIEGQGVPLTVRVPVDESTALSSADAVLLAAEEVVSSNQ